MPYIFPTPFHRFVQLLILSEDGDPWLISGDLDADLEYTISALKDEVGASKLKEGNPEQDIYYIHEFEMASEYNDLKLKAKSYINIWV